jgi:hypothetical protein
MVNSSAGTPDTIRSILGYDDYFGMYKPSAEIGNDDTRRKNKTRPGSRNARGSDCKVLFLHIGDRGHRVCPLNCCF